MILVKVLFMLFTTSYAFFSSTALPGCASSCGGVDIPYPFGLGSNCAFPGFEVTCYQTETGEQPYLQGYPLLGINISAAEARISNSITWQCHNFSTKKTISGPDGVVNLNNTQFSFSSRLNKLIVIGCNTLGESSVSLGGGHPYGRIGCVSFCINAHFDRDYGPCAGVGCCQIDIHRGLKFSQVYIETKMYSYFPDFNPCRYAVLMEAASFNFSTAYVNGTTSLIGRNMSLVLDWTIGNSSCTNSLGSQDYLCKSMDSNCSNSSVGGYTCHCSDGFQGNPYVKGGCTDIDECARNYTCQPNQKCVNVVGTYECVCPWGMRVNGEGRCDLIGLGIMIGVGVCVTLLILAYVVFTLIKVYKKRLINEARQKNSKRHRDIILRKHHDITGRMTIFGIEELEKATNKFDETLIVGHGGHGIIYKGILADQRIVAVKKPKIEIDREIEEFLNEVVILSQLNHRNVVKLFGCCIENEVPLVVYEFISNGTLTDHLHVEEGPSLSWNDRLRIALETAGALSYLHTAASMSVFHRDIKTSNILLNDGLATKLSDFGASRSVAADVVTAKDTEIQGTLGYLDPEYYQTGRLTAKSDVFSFGVILAELLTKMKPISLGSIANGGSLVTYFRFIMREGRLHEILDPQIEEEEHIAEVESVAVLTEMCVRSKGEERPTMKEVEMRLEVLWSSKPRSACNWNSDQRLEQQQNLIEDNQMLQIGHMSGDSLEYESMLSNFPR